MKKLFLLLFYLFVTLEASDTYYFRCQDGYNFAARYEDEKMWLFLPRVTVALREVEYAEPSRMFTDDKINFILEGEHARVAFDGLGYLFCENDALRAQKEQEKFDGYDFRAHGYNQRGWKLLLRGSGRSSLIYEEGKKRFDFKLPNPVRSGDSTLYIVKKGDDRIFIELHGRRCIDKKSGRRYESIVTIRLNALSFAGCGEALH